MQRGNLLLGFVFACAVAWCQRQSPRERFDSKATPADVSIDCHVNAAERVVSVTLLSLAKQTHYVQEFGPPEYDVVITTSAGKRLPKPESPKSTASTEYAVRGSVVQIALGPQAGYARDVPLSDFAVIPKGGGKFRVRIGRGLPSMWGDPFKPNSSEILWCKPMQVTLPRLK